MSTSGGLAGFRRLYLRTQGRERRVIEDAGGGVANLFHRQVDATCVFIDALLAAGIRGLADARHQRQGPVQNADHLSDRDVTGFSVEDVAAPPALLALEEPMARQIEEDGLQELLRKSLALSQFGGLNWPAALLVCQQQQGLQSVLRLPGKHGGNSLAPAAAFEFAGLNE